MTRPTGTPRLRAAALRYRPEEPFQDAAPRLVAKGKGLLAERILTLAQEHGISITKDPNLLNALEHLDLQRLIPPDLFQAVAILLATLYRTNRGLPPHD